MHRLSLFFKFDENAFFRQICASFALENKKRRIYVIISISINV